MSMQQLFRIKQQVQGIQTPIKYNQQVKLPEKLRCLNFNHNNSEIIAICMNTNCQEFRPCCLKCIQQNHSNHLGQIIDLNEPNKLKIHENTQQNILDVLKDFKKQLEKFLKSVTEFIQNISKQKIEICGNLQEIHDSATRYLTFQQKMFDNINNNQSSEFTLSNLINQCNQLNSDLEIGLKQNKYEDKSKSFLPTLIQRQVSQIPKILYNQKPGNQPFFSSILTSHAIEIRDYVTVKSFDIPNTKQDLFAYCDFEIPQDCDITFQIKVDKIGGSHFAVGFCQRKHHFYGNVKKNDDSKIYKNAYLLSSDGRYLTPKFPNEPQQSQVSIFSGDIVTVTLRRSSICWSLQDSRLKSLQVNFTFRKGLIPCVLLNGGSQVTLLNLQAQQRLQNTTYLEITCTHREIF